jgi:hypothetical protein
VPVEAIELLAALEYAFPEGGAVKMVLLRVTLIAMVAFWASPSFAQKCMITGKVLGLDGNPAKGVLVSVQSGVSASTSVVIPFGTPKAAGVVAVDGLPPTYSAENSHQTHTNKSGEYHFYQLRVAPSYIVRVTKKTQKHPLEYIQAENLAPCEAGGQFSRDFDLRGLTPKVVGTGPGQAKKPKHF